MASEWLKAKSVKRLLCRRVLLATWLDLLEAAIGIIGGVIFSSLTVI
jgi:hypothetical protein